MRQAIINLKNGINSKKIKSSRFTESQIKDIQAGKSTITGFVWHHNAQSAPNSMQLISKSAHDAVKHIGQGALKGGK